MKKRYWIAILCAILTLVLTVAAASADAGDVYGLATDASDLHNGDRIILVSDDGSYYQAMATDFSGMQVTVTDNTITEQNGMLALTLTETEDGWLLASNDGYLAVDGDALAIVSDSADAAVWSISIASDGTATVSCTGGAIVFDEQDGAYRFFFGSGGNEIAIYNATFETEQHPFGDGLWWSFADGKLTIGGSGDMRDIGYNAQPWNQHMSSITEVEIQAGVTSIGDYAFFNCTGLTKVTIPDSVTSIGWLALCGCTGLNEISIPNSVESIGTSAFSNTGWWNAQSNGVVYLDSALIGFKGSCGQILRVKDGTRLIADYAFNNQTQIKKITIPETVTSVGNRAFGGCTGLTSVTMPCSASIDLYAFSGCTGITTVHLTNGTGVMPDNRAVWSDSGRNAMTIILDDGIQNICSYAFSGYTGLTSLTMPCSISIGEYAFRNCTGITSVHLTKGTGIMANYSYSNYTNTPWYISRENAITVTLDDGIQNISNYMFNGCTGLTSITIPDSVTSIGDYAFCNCTGLMQITIPDSVESIGIGAFYNTGWWNVQSDGIVYLDYILLGVKGSCEQIVQIKEGTRLIAGQAFYGHTEINKVMIPDRVTFIGDSAFYNCTGMNEIAIPNSVTFIGNSAFYKCKGLNEIAIPDNVTSVGKEMFYGCSGLTSVTIGNEVTSVGSGAFEDCTGLTEITIPDKVTYIGASAFRNCSGLMSITIPNGVTWIGMYTFYNCSMLSEIMIPNSITRIDQLTFTGCKRLTDVYYLGTEAQRRNIAIDDYYNDPLLNATWHYISDPPVFKTQSLVLADSIGVNFFLQLPEIDWIDWSESYMTFTIFGIDGCTDRCDYDPDFMNPGHTYYGFTCYVNAAQLADTITATFHYGPGLKVEKTYSVKEYLGTYDEYKSSFDPKTQAMIEALADYGHYVQAFLAAQKNWTYGVEHEEMDKSYTASYDIDAIKAAAADFAIVRVNESNGDVEKITYSMAVDSATAILVYFKPAADYTGTLTVKVNGEDYTATAVSGRYEVRIPDISAHQLGRTFTIVATTEHGTATAKVSALSYVAGSLNAYASVPLTANAMASIYRYAMAAEEYKN